MATTPSTQPQIPKVAERFHLKDLVSRYHRQHISDQAFDAICDGAIAITQGATKDDLYDIVNVANKPKSSKL